MTFQMSRKAMMFMYLFLMVKDVPFSLGVNETELGISVFKAW